MNRFRPFAVIAALVVGSSVGSADIIFRDQMYNYSVNTDVVYGSAPIGFGTPAGVHQTNLTLDVYRPVGPDVPAVLPVAILAHEGGFFYGDKADIGWLASDLARRGYVAIAINHRLYPQGLEEESGQLESNFDPLAIYDGLPFQLERAIGFTNAISDSKQAISWIQANALTLGIDADRLAFVGQSSGARLALAMGFAEATDDIGAVVSLLGALDNNEFVIDANDAPVFMYLYNGTSDWIINQQAALNAAIQAYSQGVPVALDFVPSGHDLSLLMTDTGNGSPWDRVLSFLYGHLDLHELSGQPVPEASSLITVGVVILGAFAGHTIRRRSTS